MSSDYIINNYNNHNLFKIIEKLLKNKNLLDNSLVEILLFELIFKKSSNMNLEEIAKLLDSVLRNNNFDSKDIKFLEYYPNLLKNIKLCEIESNKTINTNGKSTDKSKSDSQADNLEKLISKHFENNFFVSSDAKRLDDYILHENYIKIYNDESRFIINYSAYSVFSLFKLMEEFQEVELTRLFDTDNSIDKKITEDNEYNNITNPNDNCDENFTRKIYKGKRHDIVLSFLNSHVDNIIEDINKSSVINVEAEQKLCFSLFIIRKIIKDFTFYFSKKDLELIFNKLKHLKDYPMPIGSFTAELLETLINESYFQGLNILNTLQQKFYVDTFFAEGDNIDILDFNRVFILQSKIKSNNFMSFSGFNCSGNCLQELTNKILKNIAGFVDWRNESIITQIDKNDINSSYVCDNQLINKNDYMISFKDLLIKILLSISYNLKDELDIKSETLKKLILYYKFDNIGIEIGNYSYTEETEITKNQPAHTSDPESLKCIRHTVEFLIKIINIGLDKEKSEFYTEIKEIIISILDDISKKSLNNNLFENKKRNSTDINNSKNNKDFYEKLFSSNPQNLFSPLTQYNKQSQSYAYNLIDSEKDDFFEVYMANLKNILIKNFIPGSLFESEQDAYYCKSINTNLLKEIKMNILLVEEENIQANIYDEGDGVIKNISSLTNFINKLYLMNKNLDSYYKNKGNKSENNRNAYKSLIEDFFLAFNFNANSDRSSNVNDNGRAFGDEVGDQIIFEDTHNNINLDFNNYFDISFNYIIYLLPGNSYELFKSSSGNSNSNHNPERNLVLNNNNNNNPNSKLNHIFKNDISNLNSSVASNAKRQSQNLTQNPILNLAINNPNINNTGFLSRYIAKKDYIYRMLVSNLWSNINYETSEDEYINMMRYRLLKENINFYISEAQNIFNLYLFKIELIRAPYMIFNLNRTLTNTCNDVNESVEFLFWKNLKIIRKEDEISKKKGVNETNLITVELHCVDIFNLEGKVSLVKYEKMSFDKMLVFNITNEINNPIHFNNVSNNGWLEVFLKEKNYSENQQQDKKQKSNKNVLNELNQNDFIMKGIEQDPFIQNYKVKKIAFEAETFKNYVFKFDDHSIIDTTSIIRIEISRYERNDRHVSVPIAVFSPIN